MSSDLIPPDAPDAPDAPDDPGAAASVASSPFARGADLRAAIVGAFGAAVAAGQAGAARADHDAAVHEVRKALRRARAVLRLAAPALSRDPRDELRGGLQAARAPLSAGRDLAVAPTVAGTVALSDEQRATVDVIIARSTAAGPGAAELRQAAAHAADALEALAASFAAALPEKLGRRDLRDGVADTYRLARRALRSARRSTTSFHQFRRLAKQLTYQLDVLAAGTDGRLARRRRALAELGDQLSAAVDVLMLRDLVATGAVELAQAAGAAAVEGGDAVEPSSASAGLPAVLEALEAELAARMAAAHKHARPLFRRKPRAFARKVIRALRRDHAPPEPPDDDDDDDDDEDEGEQVEDGERAAAGEPAADAPAGDGAGDAAPTPGAASAADDAARA